MASQTIILCVSEIWISLTWFLWFGFRLDPILIKNKLPPKNVYLIVSQAWATSGPRATYGPPSTLMWPASYIWKCLNSYIDHIDLIVATLFMLFFASFTLLLSTKTSLTFFVLFWKEIDFTRKHVTFFTPQKLVLQTGNYIDQSLFWESTIFTRDRIQLCFVS